MFEKRCLGTSCDRKEVIVGTFSYDVVLSADFDDRILAHLQVVIGAKMRRGESFFFSWKDDNRIGDGRTSIWLQPTIPLSFKYFGSRTPSINRLWIEELMTSANSANGLHIVPEPDSSFMGTDKTRLQ